MSSVTATRHFGAGLSQAPAAEAGAREAARQAGALIDGDVDLAFLFLSPSHIADARSAVTAVHEELGPANLVGCIAGGVVGRGRELEEGPGVAVWAAALPGASIQTFHATAIETQEGYAIDGVPVLADPSLVVLLSDPYTFPTDFLLDALNEERPGLPIVGGIAVGASRAGLQRLVVDGQLYEEGAVGVVVSGVEVVTLVSQGCAPIGPDYVVTRAEGTLVQELAGRRALDVLRSLVVGLSAREQALAAQGVLAGLVIDENKPEYGRGDYLMRGVLGAEPVSGALAVGDEVRVGQTLRFHVRDAESADGDLRRALDEAHGRGLPAGALLFTCNGRGTNLFAEPDHDARLVEGSLGPAVAGFFCGGEIGPVGGRVFLHGFTATLAVFLETARR
jgi:small ligand-binding sensory domain FIST